MVGAGDDAEWVTPTGWNPGLAARTRTRSCSGRIARVPGALARGNVVRDASPTWEGWFLAQVALLATVAVAGFAGPGSSGNAPLAAAGWALVLAGGVLAVRGVADLRDSLTVFPRPRDGAQLVDRGAYGLVRHPIYGGLILGSIGWGLVSASPGALAAAVALGVLPGLKSVREEAWLAEAFPGDDAYRRRTRRLIRWVL